MKKYRFILIPILFIPIFFLWDYALTHHCFNVYYYINQNLIRTDEKIVEKLSSISDYKLLYKSHNDWSSYKVELSQNQKANFLTEYDSTENATIIVFGGYSLSKNEEIHVYDCYIWNFWKTYERQYLFEKNILDKIGLEYKKDLSNTIDYWGQFIFNSQWFIYLIIIFFPSISKLFGKIKQMVSQKKQ